MRQNASQSITSLRFADDVLLIGKTLSEVEEMLTDLSQEAEKYGLEMHMGKTKVLWNGIGSSQPPSKLKINEQEVEILDPHASTMYLGKSLSLTDVHDTELQHRIARAWTKFAVYKDELCNKKYELNHRLRLFDSVITPTILYGSGTWTMGRDRENTLRGTQRKMLRKVLGSGRREKELSEESASTQETSGDTVSQLSEKHEVETWAEWIQRVTHQVEAACRTLGSKIGLKSKGGESGSGQVMWLDEATDVGPKRC